MILFSLKLNKINLPVPRMFSAFDKKMIEELHFKVLGYNNNIYEYNCKIREILSKINETMLRINEIHNKYDPYPRVDQKTPNVVEQKTPNVIEQKTPDEVEQKTPDVIEQKTPDVIEQKTPNVVEQKTPNKDKQKTPDVIEQKTPDVIEQKTPDVIEQKTPDVIDQKTPDVIEQKTPDVIDQKTPDVIEQKIPDEVEQKTHNEVNQKNPDVEGITEKLCTYITKLGKKCSKTLNIQEHIKSGLCLKHIIYKKKSILQLNKRNIHIVKSISDLLNIRKPYNIVIDYETTGLGYDERGRNLDNIKVMQIGIIAFNDEEEYHYSDYIYPYYKEQELTESAIEIHGITYEFVKNKGIIMDYNFKSALLSIVLNASKVIGYNINGFDSKITYRLLNRSEQVVNKIYPKKNKEGKQIINKNNCSYDVMQVCKKIFSLPNNKLDTVKKYVLNKINSPDTFKAHDALEDCKATLMIYDYIVSPNSPRVIKN